MGVPLWVGLSATIFCSYLTKRIFTTIPNAFIFAQNPTHIWRAGKAVFLSLFPTTKCAKATGHIFVSYQLSKALKNKPCCASHSCLTLSHFLFWSRAFVTSGCLVCLCPLRLRSGHNTATACLFFGSPALSLGLRAFLFFSCNKSRQQKTPLCN